MAGQGGRGLKSSAPSPLPPVVPGGSGSPNATHQSWAAVPRIWPMVLLVKRVPCAIDQVIPGAGGAGGWQAPTAHCNSVGALRGIW